MLYQLSKVQAGQIAIMANSSTEKWHLKPEENGISWDWSATCRQAFLPLVLLRAFPTTGAVRSSRRFLPRFKVDSEAEADMRDNLLHFYSSSAFPHPPVCQVGKKCVHIGRNWWAIGSYIYTDNSPLHPKTLHGFFYLVNNNDVILEDGYQAEPRSQDPAVRLNWKVKWEGKEN